MRAEQLTPPGIKLVVVPPSKPKTPANNGGSFSLYGHPNLRLKQQLATASRDKKKKSRPRGDAKGGGLLPGAGDLKPAIVQMLRHGERFDTPLTRHGVVDKDALIKLGKSAVRPGYLWSAELTVHHMQHHAGLYRNHPNPIAETFRDLSINKILTPRSFENLIHEITNEPPLPEEEVMQEIVDAHRAAQQLFRSAKSLVWRQKRRRNRERLVEPIALELGQTYEEYDSGAITCLRGIEAASRKGLDISYQSYCAVPDEFKPLEILPTLLDFPVLLATQLGKIVVPNAIVLTETIPYQRQQVA